jgi:hypothetical protein
MSSGAVRPISAAYCLAQSMASANSSIVEISAVRDAAAYPNVLNGAHPWARETARRTAGLLLPPTHTGGGAAGSGRSRTPRAANDVPS